MKTGLFLLLSAGLFFFGCSTSPTQTAGGGTDFPNSFANLGQALDTSISNGNHWGDSVALTYVLPDPTGGAPAAMPLTPSASGASKMVAGAIAASTSGLIYDYSDTVHGIVRAFYAPVSDTATERDTITVLYDAAFRAGTWHLYSYRGEKISSVSGITQHYAYTDADGDSIINNGSGINRMFISWSSRKALGPTSIASLEIDGGADDNLLTSVDNRILSSRTGKISAAGDTLSLVTMTGYRRMPSDSTPVVFDPSDRDSCFVRIQSIDNSLSRKHTATGAILVVFPSDSSRNYPVYLSTAVSGAAWVTSSRVRRLGTDSLYFAGDTVISERVIDSSLSGLNDTLLFTFKRGPDPRDNSGIRLFRTYKHITIPRASGHFERERIFNMVDSLGTSPDGTPASGLIFYRTVHANGYWLQLDGSFTAEGISGTYRDSENHQDNAKWARCGNKK